MALRRVGRVNTGHELLRVTPTISSAVENFGNRKGRRGRITVTLWQLEKLIRVRVLRLFSFIPRNWRQTTLLGRSEWLKFEDWNWERKVSYFHFRWQLPSCTILNAFFKYTVHSDKCRLNFEAGGDWCFLWVAIFPYLVTATRNFSRPVLTSCVGKLQMISVSRLVRYCVNLHWVPEYISTYFRVATAKLKC